MSKGISVVDFIIIGAQKAGTTTLYKLLERHPEVCFATNAEPYFFNSFNKEKTIEWYHSLFSPTTGQICGEKTTYYSYLPKLRSIPQRIYEYNNEMKLIYLLRDPVERMLSAYRFLKVEDPKKGKLDFPQEVMRNPKYINISRYYTNLLAYLEYFKEKQILLLFFEDMIKDQNKTFKKVCEFLNIKEIDIVETHSNKTSLNSFAPPTLGRYQKTRLYKGIKEFIPRPLKNYMKSKYYVQKEPEFTYGHYMNFVNLFELDIRGIEEYTGRNLDIWRDNPKIINKYFGNDKE